MNPHSFLLSKLALSEGEQDHGERKPQPDRGGEPCAHSPSLSASDLIEDATWSCILGELARPDLYRRVRRLLALAELDLQDLGLLKAEQLVVWAREIVEDERTR